MSTTRTVSAVGRLRGSLRVPGDKSASHRALLISALAGGESFITGLSPGADVRATRIIIEQLGAAVTPNRDGLMVVGPPDGLCQCAQPLDCGNSGTAMRLLSGVVGGLRGRHVLVGDESLSERPMDRVAEPLSLMGVRVTGRGPLVQPPITVEGSDQLRAAHYHLPVASAQVKSAILFAALRGDGASVVTEDVRTRTTTEDMLRDAGVTVNSVNRGDGRVVTLHPGRPRAHQWRVLGDPSQAAFFAVLGAIHPDAELNILELDATPERIGFAAVLERMGAMVAWRVGAKGPTLHTQSSSLVATEIFAHEIPSVDEVPALAVAAAAAAGVSAFRNMGELRMKESDRFAASMTLVHALGCRTWADGDDFFVDGLGGAGAFHSFQLAAKLDHRMVMSSAVAAAAGHGGVIDDADTVASSYPHFFDDLASLQ